MSDVAATEVVSYMDATTARALGDSAAPASHLGRRQKPIEPFIETADRHKEAGTRLSGRTRLAGLKQAVIRVARLYTVEQAAFNQAVVSALVELNIGLHEIRADIDRRLSNSQAAIASTDLAVEQTREAVDKLERRIADLRAVMGESDAKRDGDRAEVAELRSRVYMLLEEARARLPEPFDAEQVRRFTQDLDEKLAPLYRQLEDRFRGSREDIVELQKDYLPDVLDLKGGGAPVVDIGCGRGEWLEVLKDNDIASYGVDLNALFVADNQARGLDVRVGDAVEHLESVAPGSIGAVTGFHIAEHLPLELLVRLVDAALVAVQPGGLMILETPNPTNLVVGSSAFYIDPTHRNPLHPHFLQFLLEARGWADVELRFVHPAAEQEFQIPPLFKEGTPEHDTARRMVDHLNWAFFGPQDYAVIGRKPSVD